MDEVTYLPIELRLTIELQSPLHIGSGFGAGQRLDDTIVQGPHPLIEGSSGLPYIPGSSLKGRLRHHARTLAESLGWSPGSERTQVEAQLFGYADSPGRLQFRDAHLADLALARAISGQGGAEPLPPWLVRSERSFVGLSPRRVAAAQRLFRIEMAEPTLRFDTQISGNLPGPEGAARRSLALLIAAARALTHLGGHKGRGLGACHIAIPDDGLRLGDHAVSWRALLEEL